MHGVNALTWDDTIAAHAQQYATSTGGTMRHSSYTSRQGVGGFNVGENLASGVTDAGAVDMWYNEIQHTSGGLVSEFGMNTGHYTQVVWRDTSRLGCGIQGTLLVCQYGESAAAADEYRWSGDLFCTKQNTEFVCLATVLCFVSQRAIPYRLQEGHPGH